MMDDFIRTKRVANDVGGDEQALVQICLRTEACRHGQLQGRIFSKYVVVVPFALSSKASVAVEYLQSYRKGYHNIHVSKDEVAPVVEQWVAELPQYCYDRLLLPLDERSVKPVAQARKFFAEHSAAAWIEHNSEAEGWRQAPQVPCPRLITNLLVPNVS